MGPESSPRKAPSGRPVVVKIGGSTLGSSDTTLDDLVRLQCGGAIPVVVHGGGNIISQWMERSNTFPRFVRGLRVTDQPTLEVVTAVLAGLVNKQLVAAIQAKGGRALGFSGVDGGLLQAEVVSEELGLVGDVVKVCPDVVQQAAQAGYIPVIAPLAIKTLDEGGEPTILNVNGDTAAGAIAAALMAEDLVFLTDVAGVMDSSRRLIPRVSPQQARALISGGVASGGMIPKIEACIRALPHVASAHIVDGRKPGALLGALGASTMGTRIG